MRRDITVDAEMMGTRRTSVATGLRCTLRTSLHCLLAILRLLAIRSGLLVRRSGKRSQTAVALDAAFFPGFLPADFCPVPQWEEVVV